MVADNVKVISRAYGSESGHIWESDGASGFTIGEYDYDRIGTEVILTIKKSADDENYDEFLEEYRLRALVKKYSDFIRYPIKMLVSKSSSKRAATRIMSNILRTRRLTAWFRYGAKTNPS